MGKRPSYQRPYTGKRRHKGSLILICLLCVSVLAVFVTFNLGNVADFFRGYSFNNPTEPQNQMEDTEPDADMEEETQPDVALSSFENMVLLPSDVVRDRVKLDEFILAAKAAGVTGVIVDIKDENGKILFDLDITYSFKEDVVEKGISLSDLSRKLKEADMTLTGRIACFFDNIAPRKNNAMAIQTSGVTWLDYNYKSYLNPFSQLSQEYLGDIAVLSAEAGASEILLYDVFFPPSGKLNVISNRGNSRERFEALEGFVDYIKGRLEIYDVKIGLETDAQMLELLEEENSGLSLLRLLPMMDFYAPHLADNQDYASFSSWLKFAHEQKEDIVGTSLIPIRPILKMPQDNDVLDAYFENHSDGLFITEFDVTSNTYIFPKD